MWNYLPGVAHWEYTLECSEPSSEKVMRRAGLCYSGSVCAFLKSAR
jgi:hypothetical protein